MEDMPATVCPDTPPHYLLLCRQEEFTMGDMGLAGADGVPLPQNLSYDNNLTTRPRTPPQLCPACLPGRCGGLLFCLLHTVIATM